uniref:Uncharacterized protein n=1 Tax=Avena sativa TaxID=4498 RepID=A0ACD5WEL1_AVESA
MGRKNRKPLSNPTPTPPAAGAGDVAAVRADCDKALAYLQRGNQPKALRLIREALARQGEGSPLLLRALGTVHTRAAAVLTDPAGRARHHREALQAARRAVDLAPDSLDLAQFRAMLLYETASDSGAYEEVIAECERGLKIEVPSDPATHSLRLPAPDTEELRAELRGLIQKANLASISAWVKSLGGEGDAKHGFFHMPDDTVELHPLPAAPAPAPRWANEIKKATKTPEERRKEVEVQLAVLRLVEQQQLLQPNASSSSRPQSEGDEDEAPCSSPQCDVGLRRV